MQLRHCVMPFLQKQRRKPIIALSSPQFASSEEMLGRLDTFLGARLGIKVNTFTATVEESLDALRAGNVDAVCTIGEFSSSDTDAVTVGNTPTGVTMAAGHPLAGKRAVSLRELADYQVVFSPKFDSFNRSILNTYLEHGLKSEVVTIDTSEKTHDFFLTRNGVGFAAYLPAMGSLFPGTVTVPVRLSEMERIPLCLVTLKSSKSEAYLELERRVGEIFRSGVL